MSRDRDAEVVRLASEGVRWTEIAERVGMSERGVYHLRRRVGIPDREPGCRDSRRDAEILRMWSEGMTTAEVARSTALSIAGVQQALKRLDAPRRRVSKLPADVDTRERLIRALWPNGEIRCAEIANLLGLSEGGLARIARRLGLPARQRGRRRGATQ